MCSISRQIQVVALATSVFYAFLNMKVMSSVTKLLKYLTHYLN